MRHPAVLLRQFFTTLLLCCERKRLGICKVARKLRQRFRTLYCLYFLPTSYPLLRIFFFVDLNGKVKSLVVQEVTDKVGEEESL